MRWFWILILAGSIIAIIVLVRPREDERAEVTNEIATNEIAPNKSPAIVSPATTHSDRPSEIPGSGSPTDPYRVSWSLMKSAQDVNEPNGQVRVPSDLALIDGMSIEISGYLAPPVQQDVTSELLVMQKRWDGCCIGTPPTPFDCIEVRLNRPITMRGRHLIQYGTIRGTLHIEPFTAGKFLLGLYRIEQGSIEGEIAE